MSDCGEETTDRHHNLSTQPYHRRKYTNPSISTQPYHLIKAHCGRAKLVCWERQAARSCYARERCKRSIAVSVLLANEACRHPKSVSSDIQILVHSSEGAIWMIFMRSMRHRYASTLRTAVWSIASYVIPIGILIYRTVILIH